MKNGKMIKEKLCTKRNVLYFVNIIFFVLVCMFYILYVEKYYGYIPWFDDSESVIILFVFLVVQCLFTFLSLIVYYLSIMADALNKKYREETKGTEYEDKK